MHLRITSASGQRGTWPLPTAPFLHLSAASLQNTLPCYHPPVSSVDMRARCVLQVRLDLLLNMDGLYIGDRYKKGPVWYPKQVRSAQRCPSSKGATRAAVHGGLRWAGPDAANAAPCHTVAPEAYYATPVAVTLP